MNSKRSKQIRKALKANGIDVTNREYRKTYQGIKVLGTQVTPQGVAPVTAPVYTQGLVPECGRQLYLQEKKNASRQT